MSLYDDRKYISAVNGDIAHTCGNVCAIITDDLVSKFRPKFFKHIHKTSEIAVTQFKKLKDYDISEFKWSKPFLIVQPKLLITDPTDAHIDIWRRMYGTNMYDITRQTEETAKFFCDSEKGILLDYSIERVKMAFHFIMEFSTQYQQYNAAAKIVNTFRLENAYYKPAIIENIIPDNIIKRISEDSGIPIRDSNGSPNKFLSYLNNKSRIPITLEYQPATGQYRFRLMGQINLLMAYRNLDVTDGGNENMVQNDFNIEMDVHMEFNYPSRFFYVTDFDNKPTGIDREPNEIEPIENEETGFFYTMQRCIIPDNDVHDKQLKIVLAIELDNEERDTIDFSTLLEEEYIEVLKKLKEDNIPLTRFINIVVYENADPFDIKKYSFDLETKILTLHDTSIYNTYRIALYVDNVLLNEYKLRNYNYD